MEEGILATSFDITCRAWQVRVSFPPLSNILFKIEYPRHVSMSLICIAVVLCPGTPSARSYLQRSSEAANFRKRHTYFLLRIRIYFRLLTRATITPFTLSTTKAGVKNHDGRDTLKLLSDVNEMLRGFGRGNLIEVPTLEEMGITLLS